MLVERGREYNAELHKELESAYENARTETSKLELLRTRFLVRNFTPHLRESAIGSSEAAIRRTVVLLVGEGELIGIDILQRLAADESPAVR